MTHELHTLFENNLEWSESKQNSDPDFFRRLLKQQAPRYLWIGCSDSRVPANQIIGLDPGEVFVHRNVANLVVHTDLNALSVIQYAVDVLQVEHILVVGHYGCGGVTAALRNQQLGLVDNWLRHVQDVRERHAAMLDALPDETARINALCELNVRDQVENVSRSSVLRDAWARRQRVAVHGWCYRLTDGLVTDLQVSVHNQDEAQALQDDTRRKVFGG
ncbi:MAG: carbonate dehydratase [Rhodocyclaceae bacterium]|nr:carbonate dehydratase [Rhodocyclaceae bacterium]